MISYNIALKRAVIRAKKYISIRDQRLMKEIELNPGVHEDLLKNQIIEELFTKKKRKKSNFTKKKKRK